MNKYTTIQIKKDTHALLQEYCREHGYKLSGLVDSLIKQRINKKQKRGVISSFFYIYSYELTRRYTKNKGNDV